MIRCVAMLAAAGTVVLAAPAVAQSATARQAAYGARLTKPAAVVVNERRINNRINNRIGSRISTRIERYETVADADERLRASAIEGAQQANERARQAVEQPVPQSDHE